MGLLVGNIRDGGRGNVGGAGGILLDMCLKTFCHMVAYVAAAADVRELAPLSEVGAVVVGITVGCWLPTDPPGVGGHCSAELPIDPLFPEEGPPPFVELALEVVDPGLFPAAIMLLVLPLMTMSRIRVSMGVLPTKRKKNTCSMTCEDTVRSEGSLNKRRPKRVGWLGYCVRQYSSRAHCDFSCSCSIACAFVRPGASEMYVHIVLKVIKVIKVIIMSQSVIKPS